MKHTRISKILLTFFAVVLCFGPVGLAAEPLGTAFTYQGRLIDVNKAADGLYDFQFKLFDADTGGNQLGPNVNKPEVDVIDGYFTVELDFGSVFDGSERWLDIGVRPGDQNDPNVYTTLDPRQKVTAAPYALYSLRTRGISITDVNNTFLGDGAGINNGGSGNTFAGYWAGSSNTGSYNTFLGYMTGRSNTANYNIFIGDKAGYSNTWGYCNTYIGHAAGYSGGGGYYNTFTGYLAGYNNTAYDNTFSGYRAGVSNTSGNDNTFIGYQAGQNNTSGNGNTFLGASAGNDCNTGAGNVFIGRGAGYSETGSNKLYIDNDSSGALIYGDFASGRVGISLTDPTEALDVQGTARLRGISGNASGANVYVDANGKLYKSTSSRRYKTNIENLDAQTDSVLNLRPVRFEYKETGQKDIGLIAEEVEKISSDLVVYDNQNRPDAVKYEKVSLYLLGIVKELKAENELLRQRLDVLEKTTTAKETQQ